MISIANTPFKLTHAEKLLSAATTLCLLTLSDAGAAMPKVSDISEPPQYGFTASASWEPCGPRFVRITDVQAGSVDWANVPYCECANPDAYALKSGDILVARSGSTGKTFLVETVPESAVFASYMIRLRTKPSVIPAYLYWCFQSQQFWHQMLEARRGSAMSNINGKMLSELRFPVPALHLQEAIVCFLNAFRQRLRGYDVPLPPLPTPLDEQRRIVARIEALAARIEQAQGLRLAAAKELDGFALSSVVRLLYGNYPSLELGAVLVPVDRREAPIGGHQYRQIGVKWWGKGVYERETIDGSETQYAWMSPLRTDDVVINKIWARHGSVGVVSPALDGCYASTEFPIFEPIRSRVEPRWIHWLAQTQPFWASCDEKSRGSSGKNRIRPERFLQIAIPVPSLDEQRRVIRYLDEQQARIDVLKRLQEETSAELDALLPSVLDKAFREEL